MSSLGRAERSSGPPAAKRQGRHVTLKDIARRAGVSEAAASFALNDKPGVSESTRERVRKVAADLQWRPSHAARSLSVKSSGTVGLVASRSAQAIGTEAFFLRLMTGIQDVLACRHYALLLQVVSSLDEEIATYRRWFAEQRVDGVVLVDLRLDDPRPRALSEMGLPAVLAGGPEPSGLVPAVQVDDSGAMAVVLDHLSAQGFESVGYISGPVSLTHIARRIVAFDTGIASGGFTFGRNWQTDFTAAAAAHATEEALTGPSPAALVFDNEALAMAGLGVISRLNRTVPGDVGVISFENTALCEALDPSLTALDRDAFAFGADVANRLFEVLDDPDAVSGDWVERPPQLIARESTQRRAKGAERLRES